MISGNKYQRDTDLPALPGVLGLKIVRHYNSAQRGLGLVGRGWRTPLIFSCDPLGAG
ncbi:MAG: hypothetical protein KJZ96_08270 [Rhodocyclaceae bacterium]|nr:hypothetical protein [Rhodocyclaceae bacterium]MCL4758331.1 hypothetical protein [Rhodocyclaceae bacterium]